jgi:hypothetical protein
MLGSIRNEGAFFDLCSSIAQEKYKATWNRKFKLPCRKAGLLKQIISMIKWIRISRSSIRNSLSLQQQYAFPQQDNAYQQPPGG